MSDEKQIPTESVDGFKFVLQQRKGAKGEIAEWINQQLQSLEITSVNEDGTLKGGTGIALVDLSKLLRRKFDSVKDNEQAYTRISQVMFSKYNRGKYEKAKLTKEGQSYVYIVRLK